MENNKVTVWHFIVPSLMVACLSLVITCYVNETTNERLLLTNEILIRRNHLLDSLFKASDREDDSLRAENDSVKRLNKILLGNLALDGSDHDNQGFATPTFGWGKFLDSIHDLSPGSVKWIKVDTMEQ
jgi:hypothetical protein